VTSMTTRGESRVGIELLQYSMARVQMRPAHRSWRFCTTRKTAKAKAVRGRMSAGCPAFKAWPSSPFLARAQRRCRCGFDEELVTDVKYVKNGQGSQEAHEAAECPAPLVRDPEPRAVTLYMSGCMRLGPRAVL